MDTISTKYSRFSCHPEFGLQWGELVFFGKDSQKGLGNQEFSLLEGYHPGGDFLGSGCFFMFPWVNRMEPNPYESVVELRDGNGIPLHGLISKHSWKLETAESDHLRYSLTTSFPENCSGEIRERIVQLVTEFWIYEDSLRMGGSVKNLSSMDWDFGLGFHPYFSLGRWESGKFVRKKYELIFKGKLSRIELDEKMLPCMEDDGNRFRKVDYFNLKTCLENKHFDDLFAFSDSDTPVGIELVNHSEQTILSILDHSHEIPIEKRIPLNHWQIYTPDHGRSIAIEPMNTVGNYKNLSSVTKMTLSPNQEKNFLFSVIFLIS